MEIFWLLDSSCPDDDDDDDDQKWVTHSRLLGVLIDDQLNWSKHVSVVKKGFVDKLNLLKRSKFLPKNMLLDLYFRVIMP